MILHIPHSSLTILAEVRKKLRITDTDLALELLRLTDWYTDELFALDDYQIPRVVYPFSRIQADVERFPDDASESMSLVGMGAIYEKTTDGKHLRDRMRDEERNAYLERYYYPHHGRLQELTDRVLLDQKRCLIVDCHSFPSVALAVDQDQAPDRPDICLGSNLHTPPDLVRVLENACADLGLSCAVNHPYTGTIVPQKYFGRDQRVKSIMIEIRRGLYMDESNGLKLAAFESIRAMVRSLLLELWGYWKDCDITLVSFS